jgi:hypothetical protein
MVRAVWNGAVLAESGHTGEATDGAGRGLAGRIRARVHRAGARP